MLELLPIHFSVKYWISCSLLLFQDRLLTSAKFKLLAKQRARLEKRRTGQEKPISRNGEETVLSNQNKIKTAPFEVLEKYNLEPGVPT